MRVVTIRQSLATRYWLNYADEPLSGKQIREPDLPMVHVNYDEITSL